jgi:CheY-like chemotaxis protein
MKETFTAMHRVRIIHWSPAEAASLIDSVRAAGFDPEYDGEISGPAVSRAIRAHLPDAVLIDLSRLPSHGREIGIWLRGIKATRHIPLVFVNGEGEKLERVRKDLPDAAYANPANLKDVLRSSCRGEVRDPLVPQMMERYKDKPAAQKLGIAAASTVAVMNAPRDYAHPLGELPEGVELFEDPRTIHPVTLWFVLDLETLLAALPRMRVIAAKTKLWIVWRKGREGRISQNAIRETAIESGLVDYKICSLDAQWSGILFARKKS